ncbi:hypothetical protein PET44_32065 [Streptomyces goshikiensis]|nr:hypothetical protein [Streptomyces goshikiensis]WBY24343.1 hypothetical protein PET44_32065 [Streptomyces goshikiensis]
MRLAHLCPREWWNIAAGAAPEHGRIGLVRRARPVLRMARLSHGE